MFCQVTKEKLINEKDFYYCESLGIRYPVKDNIVFMGYEKSQRDKIIKILLDSQQHQGTAESLESDYKYSKISYPLIAQLISTFKKLYVNTVNNGGIAVNVGSGGDPSSNEIASLGFETYACDIEPNSVYTSTFWDDVLQSKVNRIACDCFCLPFPDSSVSFLYCKEFLHHMENYDSIINEFNRVLSVGGIALIIEPTLTHRTTKGAIDFPGHHYVSNSKYISSFIVNGFSIEQYYLHYIVRKKKLKQKISSIPYQLFNNSFIRAKKSYPVLKKIIQKVIDGQNIWFLKKNKAVEQYDSNKIKNLEIINTDFLTIDNSFFENEYFEKAANDYERLREHYNLYRISS